MGSNLRKTSNIVSNIKSNLDNSYTPIFYYPKNPSDQQKLNSLIESDKKLTIHNEIIGQLEELIKSKNPKKKFSKEELEKSITNHIGDNHIDDYGVWVHYPWSNRLVHILDEEEFVEVRTNRNQNKITLEEQEVLRTKKIGVIGLSVGQSVALTIAMERTAGEISIADYDILELSNLNRIRTGVHTLNLPKTVAVAQEIAEIDPYVKVNCFHEGITENNIDEFLLKNRKLDILIDECDGLDIKFLCRTRAKEHQIPVVMDTSDRGMIDVERFDLEPNRSIFHGLIDHMDTSKIKEAKTNEEKVPYVLAIIGWETISDKMKASMVEIEQSVSTWPQLASAVASGGGMACDVSRRILLSQFHDSGRYFVDVEELIADKKILIENTENEPITDSYHQLSVNEMLDIAKDYTSKNSNTENNLNVSEGIVKQLISKAILAPTGGNSQPWHWVFHKNQLFLFQNKGETNKFLDLNSFGTILGLGAATENLILEANKNNIEIKLNLFPINNNENLVAQILFNKKLTDNPYEYLAEYIDQRSTDRNIYPSLPIDSESLDSLKRACSSISGAKLHLLTGEENIKKYGSILGKSDKMLLTTKETHAEFMKEIRWSEEEVNETKTGVDIETIDLTATEAAGFKVIKNWSVVKHLNKWGGGGAFEKLSKKCAESAYAIGIVTVPKLDRANFFNGGRALERVWLEAIKNNLNIHPISALTYIFTRLNHGKAEGMDDRMIKITTELRKEHEELFDTKNEIEVFLFRVFKGDKPKKKSLRKPIEDIFTLNH